MNISTNREHHILRVVGCLGFLLCAWLAYESMLHTRNSVARVSTIVLGGGMNTAEHLAAGRANIMWVSVTFASVLLAIVLLSFCFGSWQSLVLRRSIGLVLFIGAVVPTKFALTILKPSFNSGATISPGTHVTTTSWSSGGITLHGWPMYAAGVLFSIAAVLMLIGGVHLLIQSRNENS